jgi:hypothetical protein
MNSATDPTVFLLLVGKVVFWVLVWQLFQFARSALNKNSLTLTQALVKLISLPTMRILSISLSLGLSAFFIGSFAQSRYAESFLSGTCYYETCYHPQWLAVGVTLFCFAGYYAYKSLK